MTIRIRTIAVYCDEYGCYKEDEGTEEELGQAGWKIIRGTTDNIED